jgi:DNA (cytosine-5)-methyltransferase 1
MLNGLDLFSGIGGIGIALSDWVRTVAYCERERYAQGVLLSRMQSGEIDTAPIWDDVTTLRGDMLPRIDIIFGGFPCQDLSVAGAGKGLDGERSGLFFEIVRLAKELRPVFLFLENVPAIRSRGLDAVLKELTALGYDCRWTVISAASIGAPHKRERWFLLAHSNTKRERFDQRPRKELRSKEQKTIGSNFSYLCEESSSLAYSYNDGSHGTKDTKGFNQRDGSDQSRKILTEQSSRSGDLGKDVSGSEAEAMAYSNSMRKLSEQGKYGRISNCSKKVSNASGERLEGYGQEPIRIETKLHYASDNSWWAIEPSMGRVAHGIPNRVHRIKCLGNGVVPLQVKTAFKRLINLA